MERHYETICIVKPDVAEEVTKGIIQKSTAVIETGKGKLNKVDDWGRRKLGYAIEKKHEGYYFVMDYTSEPAVSKEIERLMKLNESVLRCQTISLIETKPPKKKKKKKTDSAAVKPVEGGQANGNG